MKALRTMGLRVVLINVFYAQYLALYNFAKAKKQLLIFSSTQAMIHVQGARICFEEFIPP